VIFLRCFYGFFFRRFDLHLHLSYSYLATLPILRDKFSLRSTESMAYLHFTYHYFTRYFLTSFFLRLHKASHLHIRDIFLSCIKTIEEPAFYVFFFSFFTTRFFLS
jgi:hypothetical protein